MNYRRKVQKQAGWLAAAALLAACPLFAGVVYEIEVTDHSASPPKSDSAQTSVQDGKMKVKTGSGRHEGEMIYRGDPAEMMMIDHDERAYTVIDKQAIAELGAQMNAAERQMQEALKNVPAGQREAVERMMKQRMPPQAAAPQRSPVELRKTGETATHNGYPCVKYEVLRDGRKLRELWITDWDNVEGSEEVVSAFKGMAEFFNEMMESFPQFVRGRAEMDDNLFEYMNRLDGFPVVTRELDADGSLSGESTLRSAKRMSLDPAEFEPPAGYKRRSMMGG